MRKSLAFFSFVAASGLPRAPFSYDIFAINIASTMLGYVYNKSGALSVNQDLGVKVATPIGNLIGQLLFGWFADVFGRKRMCTSFFLDVHPETATDLLNRRYRAHDHHRRHFRSSSLW